MKKYGIFMLLLLVVSAADAAGQFTDCNGERVLCSRQTRYPYNVCEGGQTVVYCFSYDDIPLPQNVMRTRIPLCFDQFLAMGSSPEALYIQGTKVFDNSKLLQDLHMAVDEWNCICGFDAGSPGCCVRIIFSDEEREFRNPDRAAEAGYVSNGCFTDCAHAVVKVNISTRFVQAGKGTDVRSFYNGNYPPLPPSGNYALYSLVDIVQHELGHVLGFDHYSVGGCQGAGIMDEVKPNIGRTGLSDDDRCRFAYLYCSTVVPVAENREDAAAPGIHIFPNPTEHSVTISYLLAAPAQVSIQITDVDGRLVGTLHDSAAPAGKYEETYDLSALAGGRYFVTLHLGGRTVATTTVVVSR